MIAAMLPIPSEFEGIGKLADTARLGMDHVGHWDEVAGIDLGQLIDQPLLFGGPAIIAIDIPLAAQKSIPAKSHQHFSHLMLTRVEPFRDLRHVPLLTGAPPKQQQRLQLGDRVYLSLDKIPNLVWNSLICHPNPATIS
jgi:hypothetical protein